MILGTVFFFFFFRIAVFRLRKQLRVFDGGAGHSDVREEALGGVVARAIGEHQRSDRSVRRGPDGGQLHVGDPDFCAERHRRLPGNRADDPRENLTVVVPRRRVRKSMFRILGGVHRRRHK